MSARIHDWANGAPRGIQNSSRSHTTALYMSNVPGQMRLIIANKYTGDILEFPDDGMVFVFLNQEAAASLRDELLNPSEFPHVIE